MRSFATHDARLIEIVESLAGRYGRARQTRTSSPSSWAGRRAPRSGCSADGERVRVYVPYGPDWFERLVGGLAEQPGTVTAAAAVAAAGGVMR